MWKCDTSGVGKGVIDGFPGLRVPTAALPEAILFDLYEVGRLLTELSVEGFEFLEGLEDEGAKGGAGMRES